jgi:aspartyl-tRNA(Asn)/glutamyl-tRNA(Gln) amidotransferase subunit C
MKITAKEVRYVADLARLELSPEEVELFTGDMNRILDYMDQLNELDTGGVEPTSHVLSLKNVFREDVVVESLPVDEVLANAPRREKGHFVVPKIIE